VIRERLLKRKFTEVQAIQVIERYRSGQSSHVLALAYEVSVSTICRLLHHHNIPIRHPGNRGYIKLTEVQITQIVKRYHAGESSCALSAYYKISVAAICGLLHRRNVSMRYPKGKKGYRTHDTSVFDAITPESAYWIGFLMADGNVWGTHIQLALAHKDETHVRRFRDFLKSDHAVCRTENAYRFCVSSRRLADALAQWGVVPRKSHIAATVDALVLNRDFWRGVVDGDGSVRYMTVHGNRYPELRLVGSFPLMSQFLSFVQTHAPGQSNVLKSGSIFLVALVGRRATKMIKVLYADCSGLALQRKLDTANSILESKRVFRSWKRQAA